MGREKEDRRQRTEGGGRRIGFRMMTSASSPSSVLRPLSTMPVDLTACLAAAETAARGAATILESWRARFSVREKGRADLVTEADVASQQAVREYLLGRFPDH